MLGYFALIPTVIYKFLFPPYIFAQYLMMRLSLRQVDNRQLKVNPNNKQKPLINIQSLANLIDKL